MTNLTILYIILFVLFVLVSGFFESAETAFVSLQRYRLEHMIASGVKGARQIAGLLAKPERLISVVILGANFFETAAATLGTVVAVAMFGQGRGTVIATIATTIILVIFAQTTPKTIGARHSERVAFLFASPIKAAELVLMPFVAVLSWISAGIARIFGASPSWRALLNEEEILTMISAGEKAGVVDEHEAQMMHKVFEFTDRPVVEVMVPRVDVVAIEEGARLPDFMKLYTQSPVGRFPVYRETLDNIIGIVSMRDVLMALAKGSIDRESKIDELIRPAYFVPETKRINELLAELRERNHRMAVVVDEYGGTAGIVGLTGLVEEIVGPLGNELVTGEKEYEIIDEHTFQVDGSMRVEEVNQAMGLNLPGGEDYETVAGLVLKIMGRVPKQGDRLRYRGLRIIVTRMLGMKVAELLITREKGERDKDAKTPR